MGLEKLSMRELVISVAGHRLPGDTRESWLRRAARKAGISHRSAKAVWYGEISGGNSIERLKEAALANAQSDIVELAQRFESAAHALNVADPDFHLANIDALRAAAHALRGMGRPGNGGGQCELETGPLESVNLYSTTTRD